MLANVNVTSTLMFALASDLLMMCLIEQSFPSRRRRVFNNGCGKTDGKSFRSQDHYAPELFALELIHEFWRCSIVYSLPQLPEAKYYSWSTMSSSEL